MYCKHCGKEITSDSKFCSHCGKSQDNTNNTLTNKPFWIIYLIWAVANFYLLTGKKNYYTSEVFYPFTEKEIIDNYGTFRGSYKSWDNSFYDFSDFLIYVFVIPSLFYLAYLLFRKIRRKKNLLVKSRNN